MRPGTSKRQMGTFLITSLLVLLTCLIFSPPCNAKNLGVFGAVYDITEKDALKEIEERAKEVDMNRFVNRVDLAKKIRNYTPEDLKEAKLQPARKERIFLVDMTYTLERDIADEKGNIIYPKGYTFNPLNYITYPGTLVIINGRDPAQLAWFKHSEYAKDLKVKVIITGGSYSDLSKTFRRPVFYANRALVDVFQIKATPSVVKQKGTIMEVREILVSKKKDQ